MNRLTSFLLVMGGLIAFPLMDSAIKGTLILVLASTVCVWLRKDSAATRHFVWAIAVCLLVAMPLLSLVLPQWRILPGWMRSEPVTIEQVAWPTPMDVVDRSEIGIDRQPAPSIAFQVLPADSGEESLQLPNAAVQVLDAPASDVAAATSPIELSVAEIPAWIGLAWLIGCSVLAVRLSSAAILLRRSERRCTILPGERLGVSPPCRPGNACLDAMDYWIACDKTDRTIDIVAVPVTLFAVGNESGERSVVSHPIPCFCTGKLTHAARQLFHITGPQSPVRLSLSYWLYAPLTQSSSAFSSVDMRPSNESRSESRQQRHSRH